MGRRHPAAWTRLVGGALAVLVLLVPRGASASLDELPRDLELSPVVWAGYGGGEAHADCGPLAYHPVILIHDDGDGPGIWRGGDDGGVVAALEGAGFGPCEVWALKVGDAGVPLRSLEELTDDVKEFIHAVLAYTGAPRVQLVAEGAGAVLAHATLRKYALHDLVHAVVYVDGPFGGRAGCTDERCFAGEVLCCSLRPDSSFLVRTLLPLETPCAVASVPDHGRVGHLRYLVLGSTRAVDVADRTADHGAWMLDGAWNLCFPGLADHPLHRVPDAWSAALRTLSDPAEACTADRDADGDGFCAASAGGNDCDDGDPGVHPGAPEVEADGVDQDCNHHDLDRRFVGWKCERPLAEPREVVLSDPEELTPRPEGRRGGWWLGATAAVLLLVSWALLRRYGRGRP